MIVSLMRALAAHPKADLKSAIEGLTWVQCFTSIHTVYSSCVFMRFVSVDVPDGTGLDLCDSICLLY